MADIDERNTTAASVDKSKSRIPGKKDNYIITLKKNKDHQPRAADDKVTSCGGTLLPKLPPKKKYIITMDRYEKEVRNDIPILYVPKYKLNVGNMDVRYPVLSVHPKFGSRHMVLDEKPVEDIYGTDKPTMEDFREKESRVLGVLDFHTPAVRPDWRLSFKGDYIYRERDPNWNGKYVHSEGKFDDSNQESNTLQNSGKLANSTNKGKVRFIERAYNSRYNEKYVYSPNTKNNHYIERSFNPRAQKQTKKKTKGNYIENSFNPHFHGKYPHSSNRDLGHYDKLPFDPNEKFNVRYLPPIERKGKYADVSSKVKSFDNVGYERRGGHKRYPTYELNWNVESKMGSSKYMQSKSYPNTEAGSDGPNCSDSRNQQPEIQSQIEFGRVADDHQVTSVSATDARSVTSSVVNSRTAKLIEPHSSATTDNFSTKSSKYSRRYTKSVRSDVRVLRLPDVDSALESRSPESYVEDTEPYSSKTGQDFQDKDIPKSLDSRSVFSNSQNLDHVFSKSEDDVNTESDVASLPKSYKFNQNRITNTSSLYSKSPVSNSQKSKMSKMQNLTSKTDSTQPHADVRSNSMQSSSYSRGLKLGQAKHSSGSKDFQVSENKVKPRNEVENSTFASSSPRQKSEKPKEEDTTVQTQNSYAFGTKTLKDNTSEQFVEVSDASAIEHAQTASGSETPKVLDMDRANDSTNNRNIKADNNKNIKTMDSNKNIKTIDNRKKSSDFRILKHSDIKQQRLQKVT